MKIQKLFILLVFALLPLVVSDEIALSISEIEEEDRDATLNISILRYYVTLNSTYVPVNITVKVTELCINYTFMYNVGVSNETYQTIPVSIKLSRDGTYTLIFTASNGTYETNYTEYAQLYKQGGMRQQILPNFTCGYEEPLPSGNPNFVWSDHGPLADLSCIKIHDPLLLGSYWDDNYLCSSSRNMSLWKWSHSGNVESMKCSRWYVSNYPAWFDNWLCIPREDIYNYIFSNTTVERSICTTIHESRDTRFGVQYFCATRPDTLHNYIDGSPSIVSTNDGYVFFRCGKYVSYFRYMDGGYDTNMRLVPQVSTNQDILVVARSTTHMFYIDSFVKGELWYTSSDLSPSNLLAFHLLLSTSNSRGSLEDWSVPSLVQTGRRVDDRVASVQDSDNFYIVYFSKGVGPYYMLGNKYDFSGAVLWASVNASYSLLQNIVGVYCDSDISSPYSLCLYLDRFENKIFYNFLQNSTWSAFATLEVLNGTFNNSSPMDSSDYIPLRKDPVDHVSVTYFNGSSWLFYRNRDTGSLEHILYSKNPTSGQLVQISNSRVVLGETAAGPSSAVLNSGIFCAYQDANPSFPKKQMSYIKISIGEESLIYKAGHPLTVDAELAIAVTSDPQYSWCDDGSPSSATCQNDSPSSIKDPWSYRLILSQYESIYGLFLTEFPFGVGLVAHIITGDMTDYGDQDGHVGVINSLLPTVPVPTYPGLGNHDYENNVFCTGSEACPYTPDACCCSFSCPAGALYWFYDYIQPLPVAFDASVTYLTDGNVIYGGSFAYSFDVGLYHIIQMNLSPEYAVSFDASFLGPGELYDINSPMDWFYSDIVIASIYGKRILVFFHVPEPTPTPSNWSISPFYNILGRFPGVCGVYNGHYHANIGVDYMINATNQSSPGIPHVYVGSANFQRYTYIATNPGTGTIKNIVIDNDVNGTYSINCEYTFHCGHEPLIPYEVVETRDFFGV